MPERDRTREHSDLGRLTLVRGCAQGPAGDRENRRREAAGVPVAVGELSQPSFDAGCGGVDLPPVGEDQQPRCVGSFRVGGLAQQQRPPGTLGKVRGHRPQEALVRVVEERLPWLPVETKHAPYLAGLGPQSRDQLLVTAQRHVAVPAGAARQVAAGRLVQGADAGVGAGHVGELVDVVVVVLAGQPRGRVLRHAVVEVAGDQQRGRVERVPARRPVVGHDPADDLGRGLPEGHQVARLARQPGNLVNSALPRRIRHNQNRRPPVPGSIYHLSGIPAPPVPQ